MGLQTTGHASRDKTRIYDDAGHRWIDTIDKIPQLAQEHATQARRIYSWYRIKTCQTNTITASAQHTKGNTTM